MDPPKRRPPRKQNPPHVKLFRASCGACGRVYEGNFPMWVQIGAFPCICGESVPAPLMFDDAGQPWEHE
ncbi:MAG: hypothetical protein WBD55_05720 [Dehalococcoidia bacterium]